MRLASFLLGANARHLNDPSQFERDYLEHALPHLHPEDRALLRAAVEDDTLDVPRLARQYGLQFCVADNTWGVARPWVTPAA